MKVLVTGNAGFIGFHTTRSLLVRGDSVVGIDVLNDYYDPALKQARLAELGRVASASSGTYEFTAGNLADPHVVNSLFAQHRFDRVIHLAAQAGVRYSLVNPLAYVESNIIGFTNVLEACRHNGTPHLTYASTSSVYGGQTTMPFRENVEVGHPLQFYAATKRANELMAHSYSHLFRLPTTGLRFFTVYGPWGRPDMAYYQFVTAILDGRPIKVFSHGKHSRDFTYVDDIVRGVILASDDIARPNPAWDSAAPDPSTSNAPFRLFNIGNSRPVSLDAFIMAIEIAVGKSAVRELLPAQPGDVPDTFADVSALTTQVGYEPTTQVEEGVAAFVRWYREYTGR